MKTARELFKMSDTSTDLPTLVAALRENAVLDIVRQRLAQGEDPFHIMEECQQGMLRIGERYEKGIYYISGLIMAGEIMDQVGELILPALEDRLTPHASGSILLGTVQGDIHYIGKNILKVLLRCHGFTVYDVGEDVPAEIFLGQARKIAPQAIGLSCLISSSFDIMKNTVSVLKAGLQDNSPSPGIIIGGMVDQQVCEYVGADYWTNDAMSGVRIFQNLIQGNQ
jgi:methanogenic corrinoid protein MtbC1